MAKDKKKPSGQHTTERRNIGVPEEWHAVMRRIAAKKKQPILWFLIELTMAEAEKEGMEMPVPPWEEDASEK